jgi:hypothetical protein
MDTRASDTTSGARITVGPLWGARPPRSGAAKNELENGNDLSRGRLENFYEPRLTFEAPSNDPQIPLGQDGWHRNFTFRRAFSGRLGQLEKQPARTGWRT